MGWNTLGLSVNWEMLIKALKYSPIRILGWEGQGTWWKIGPGEGAVRSDTPDWACTPCPEVRAKPWHHRAYFVVLCVGWGSGYHGLLSDPLVSIGQLFSSGPPLVPVPQTGVSMSPDCLHSSLFGATLS